MVPPDPPSGSDGEKQVFRGTALLSRAQRGLPWSTLTVPEGRCALHRPIGRDVVIVRDECATVEIETMRIGLMWSKMAMFVGPDGQSLAPFFTAFNMKRLKAALLATGWDVR